MRQLRQWLGSDHEHPANYRQTAYHLALIDMPGFSPSLRALGARKGKRPGKSRVIATLYFSSITVDSGAAKGSVTGMVSE
jgi:hypothetical protein